MDFSVEQLRADLRGLAPEEHGFTYVDLDRKPSAYGRLSGWVLSATVSYTHLTLPTILRV